jgi:hypothetical protein
MEYVDLSKIESLDDIDKLAIDLAFNHAQTNEEYQRYYRKAYDSIETAWEAYKLFQQEVQTND